MLHIPYKSEHFPPGTVQNGRDVLHVTWNDILWAAITVGRPNRYNVFRYGYASVYDALFRWSLIRMALEQYDPTTSYLYRTDAAKTLDPSEKSAVSYFLGMTFCKLFATKLLNTPWLLHLDVCRPQIDPILSGRSRPDLVGQEHGTNLWYAFESKGRSNPMDSNVKDRAKIQAQRLLSVNGIACSMHIGAITYFRNDVLEFYWKDPISEKESDIKINLPRDMWRYYYNPVTEIIENRGIGITIERDYSIDGIHLFIEDYDIELRVHHAVLRYLEFGEWEMVRSAAIEAKEDINEAGYQPDRLLVRSGESWYGKYVDYPYSEY